MEAIQTRRVITIGSLQLSGGRAHRERAARMVFLAAALLSIVISAAIIWSLAAETWTFVSQVEVARLWTDGWFPRRGQYDIKTIVVGSFLITGIAIIVALPLGLGAAIYLSEYARPRVRKVLKPVLEILAGIPSVVLGFFALTFISPVFVQRLNPGTADFNLLAAGLGVGILTIPLIASVSEDSMRAVPAALREASYGLGARRLTTSLRIVVPAATSGIVAAVILGISRAIGETMVVAVAAGGSGGAKFTVDPFRQGQTITAAMASLATGTDNVAGATAAFQSLFFLGLMLFIMTFVLNQLGDIFVRRTRQQY